MKDSKIIGGGVVVDDRGSVSFVNEFDFGGVKRFYQVENHRSGFIRAWHGHKHEGKYVYVTQGSALVGVVNMDTEKIEKFVLSSKTPKILWIPPGHANGFKNLEKDTPELKKAMTSVLLANFEVNQITDKNKNNGKSK